MSINAKRFGVTPLDGTRMIITDRAYTSPIWYTPGGLCAAVPVGMTR